MPYLSYTAANAALKGMVGNDATLGTLYIGLSNTEPDITTGVIGNITEPSGATGYARATIANNNTNWDVAAGVASNLLEIELPEATNNYDVTVSWGVIFDAATAGNALWFGPLTDAPKTIVLGNTPVFDPGEITVATA